MATIYLGWTIREQGNAFIATKPDAHPKAPTLIAGTLDKVQSRIRIYEGCATRDDLTLPV